MHVTFAGSPDRVEARLVPEAGYELDTFRISGFPRRPSAALARVADARGRRAARVPPILRARRPDVVLGGGGFVAGPMVFAASTLRHPDRADGGRRAPRPREPARCAVRAAHLPRLPDRRRAGGAKTRVVGRPIPARARPVPQAEAREIFELPPEGPVLVVFGALAGAQSLNEFVRRDVRRGRAGDPAHHRQARLRARAAARHARPTTA